MQCDVNEDDSILEAFGKIGDEVGIIHGVVHSLAFAHAEDLNNHSLRRPEMDMHSRKTRVHIHSLRLHVKPASHDRRRRYRDDELFGSRTCA